MGCGGGGVDETDAVRLSRQSRHHPPYKPPNHLFSSLVNEPSYCTITSLQLTCISIKGAVSNFTRQRQRNAVLHIIDSYSPSFIDHNQAVPSCAPSVSIIKVTSYRFSAVCTMSTYHDII